MRLFLALVLVVSVSAQAQRTKFCTKFKNLVVAFYDQATTCKIADAIFDKVRQQTPIADIADGFVDILVANTGIGQYPKLLGLMNNMNSCLKTAGSKLDTFGIFKTISPVFQNKLAEPYKKIKTKYSTMATNGKAVPAQNEEAFKIGEAVCTKPLVQAIITACSKNMTVKEWACANQYMPSLLVMTPYDTKRPA